jgi:hypothetical protein
MYLWNRCLILMRWGPIVNHIFIVIVNRVAVAKNIFINLK